MLSRMTPAAAPPRQQKRDKPICTDYQLSKQDADTLKGAALLPLEFRVKILERYVADHGHYGLVELFAQFIGLANSVVANTREFVEMYLVCECGHMPEMAAKLNLPTIFGALQGVEIAQQDSTKGMCGGCAYRRGTAANQSPVTTSDVASALPGQFDHTFSCHENLDEQGEPSRKCGGYLAASRQITSAPEWTAPPHHGRKAKV